MCNNVQLWRFTPTNARKFKSVNQLYLEMEHLQGHVSNDSGKAKERIKQLLSK